MATTVSRTIHKGDMARAAAMAVLLLLLVSSPGAAITFAVNSTTDYSDVNPGDGICANTLGSCSLRAAVEEANALADGDTINIPSGTFYIGDPLRLDSEMTLHGAGSATTEINGGFNDRVFLVNSDGEAVVVENVNVTMGNSPAGGGSFFTFSGSVLTIRSSIIESSFGEEGGCIINNGDMYIYSTVVRNCAANTQGGAILSRQGVLTLGSNSLVKGSTAQDGGGVYVSGGDLVLEGAEIDANTASPTSGRGGGLYVSGTATVAYVGTSTITDNSAWEGGGIYQEAGQLSVEESSLSGNTASRDGGGIYLSDLDEDTWIVNTTFSGNTADEDGGAVYSGGGEYMDLFLSSCTVTDNTADLDGNDDGNGGGIYRASSSAEVVLENTLLAGNHDASVGGPLSINPDCTGTMTSAGYNLVGAFPPFCSIGGDATGNMSGTLNSPLNPMIAPLSGSCWGGEAHRPLAGSPVVNAGNPSGCTYPNGAPLPVDQCWENRTFGPRCDIGAVESTESSGSWIFDDGFESGNASAWSSTVP